MKKLPNSENAHIAIEKLTEYCLNEFHPSGKYKANAFRLALGITIKDADILKDIILGKLSNSQCEEKTIDEFGKRYAVKMKIRIFDKQADVITSWIILEGENFPRLTSCYIK